MFACAVRICAEKSEFSRTAIVCPFMTSSPSSTSTLRNFPAISVPTSISSETASTTPGATIKSDFAASIFGVSALRSALLEPFHKKK